MKTACGSSAVVGVYTGVKGHNNSGCNSVQAPVVVLGLFPGFLHPSHKESVGWGGGGGGGGGGGMRPVFFRGLLQNSVPFPPLCNLIFSSAS